MEKIRKRFHGVLLNLKYLALPNLAFVCQVINKVPTVSIDKTDGCMVYLSKESLHTQIVSAKSSEMNVLVPDDSGEYVRMRWLLKSL